MPPKTGHKCKLYRNTGTVATPVWDEVTSVEDVSAPDLSLALGELRRRGSNFAKNLPGIFNPFAFEFRLIHGLDTTSYNAIRTAFFAQTIAEWAMMNGSITVSGNEGIRCPVIVENFPWDQPLNEVVGHDVRLAIAYMEEAGSEVDPSWYTVP